MKNRKYITKTVSLLLVAYMTTICSFAQITITDGETLWNTPVDSRVTIDYYDWYIMRKATVGGANYVLLLYARGNFYPQQFNSTTDKSYEGSLLQSYMTTLYTSLNIPTIISMAVVPSLGDHSSTSATSEPTLVLAANAGRTADIFFAPSYMDIYIWNGYKTTPLRSELMYSHRVWMRTAGSGPGSYIYAIIPQANVFDEGLSPVGSAAAVPAVWVKTNAKKILLPINPGTFFTG